MVEKTSGFYISLKPSEKERLLKATADAGFFKGKKPAVARFVLRAADEQLVKTDPTFLAENKAKYEELNG